MWFQDMLTRGATPLSRTIFPLVWSLPLTKKTLNRSILQTSRWMMAEAYVIIALSEKGGKAGYGTLQWKVYT